jgi:hypothetical protein
MKRSDESVRADYRQWREGSDRMAVFWKTRVVRAKLALEFATPSREVERMVRVVIEQADQARLMNERFLLLMLLRMRARMADGS